MTRGAALLSAALAGAVACAAAIDYGPTYGEDYSGMDYNVTRWHSPRSRSANNWRSVALECEALCMQDANCCTWTYCTPDGGSADPERCCLKSGVPAEVKAGTHWTGASKRATEPQCSSVGPPYPGPAYTHPAIHNSPKCLHDGGWHDVAGALTLAGTHHVMQGCPGAPANGWHHAASTDLVHWADRGIAVSAVKETFGTSPPCSGFLTVDDKGLPCAGFRQCSSSKGTDPQHPWDVPLQVRCAVDNQLHNFSDTPEFLPGWDVHFNRALPYDPVRPWQEGGQWWGTISMDACNTTTTGTCAGGGLAELWTSPALRGPGAAWRRVGPMFATNYTVLTPFNGATMNREFVTAGYFGAVPGDPRGGKTRVFTNNVAGAACCSGTTGYYLGQQTGGPGSPFVVDYSDPNAVGMIDWGAFAPNGKGKGLAGLDGTQSRGYSMARTLGGDPNQVNVPGRRVIVGWLGGTPASQSLSRDITLDASGALLQQFVPELAMLRQPGTHAHVRTSAGGDAGARAAQITSGQQLEITAAFTVSAEARAAGNASTKFGLNVLVGGGSDAGMAVGVDLEAELVVVGGRAGPLLPPPAASPSAGTGAAGATQAQYWLHVYVDHSIVEVIVNNRTALTVYHTPGAASSGGVSTYGAGAGSGVTADVHAWQLKSI